MNRRILGDRSEITEAWSNMEEKAQLATLFHDWEVLNRVCVFVAFDNKATEESIHVGIAAQWASRNHSSRLLCWIGVWNMTRRCLITHLLFWTSVPLNPPLAHWRLTLLAKMCQEAECSKACSSYKLLLSSVCSIHSIACDVGCHIRA